MKRKFALLIFVGMGFGAIYGVFLGTAIENSILGVAIGAISGMFIGWFGAVAAQERQ